MPMPREGPRAYRTPADDMTDRLMWRTFTQEQREQLERPEGSTCHRAMVQTPTRSPAR